MGRRDAIAIEALAGNAVARIEAAELAEHQAADPQTGFGAGDIEKSGAIGVANADIFDRRRLVFRQIASMMTIGAAIGFAAAFALTRYVTSILFDIQPHDPATFATAIGVLFVAGLAATVIPARRAMRVDPIDVLRSE